MIPLICEECGRVFPYNIKGYVKKPRLLYPDCVRGAAAIEKTETRYSRTLEEIYRALEERREFNLDFHRKRELKPLKSINPIMPLGLKYRD